MRADRLLSLLLLLQARPVVSAPELAERLEVSVRTVMRDVEALSTAGVPVYTERGRHGGIRLLEGFRSGVAHLSHAEGAGLAVGQPRLAGDLGLGDALDTAIEKIVGAGGRPLRGGFEQGRQHVIVDVDPWMRSGDPVPLLPLIHDGVVAGRRLRLDYRDSESRRREVTVDPLGLVAKAGIWYLVTAEPALFRVSRVRACSVLGDPAARPADLDLAAAWARLRERVEVRPRDLEVVVRVAPSAAAMVRRLLGAFTVGAISVADEEADLRLTFNGVAHAVGMLLGLGTRVEVLSPPTVRVAMARAAAEVAALYQRPDPGKPR